MGRNDPKPQTPPPAAPEKAPEQTPEQTPPPVTPPAEPPRADVAAGFAVPTPGAKVPPPPPPPPKAVPKVYKIDPLNPGQCQVVIPAQEQGGKDSLCPGKLVLEDVPNPGRRCTYCTNFYPK